MSEAELQLIKEALHLVDDALARVMDIKNIHAEHFASMIHIALRFGETLLLENNL